MLRRTGVVSAVVLLVLVGAPVVSAPRPHPAEALDLRAGELAPVVGVTSGAPARPAWKSNLDRITSGRRIGVMVTEGGRNLYVRAHKRRRVPASNQKVLLSMAIFDALDPSHRLTTRVLGPAPAPPSGRVEGNVWVVGEGDPTISGNIGYAKMLTVKPTRVARLARAIKNAGVTSIGGRVMGSTGYFGRDWHAPGWKSYFPSRYIPLPTALTFEGNRHRGRHIRDPEIRLARRLTKRLESLGVRVSGRPGMGQHPGGLATLAEVQSEPLRWVVKHMNRKSSNFFAEVLGKRLGAERGGPPGTIAKGAAAARGHAAALGVGMESYDGSGLSYSNRVSPRGMVRLLEAARLQAWWPDLRFSLPAGGQGTLRDRLHGVRVRAKTGTLTSISTLSGWVWLQKKNRWAQFSIMSQGMSKSSAAALEDRIVRILNRSAR